MTKINILILAFIGSLALSSCYYDTEEELYPTAVPAGNCDSIKGEYSAEVEPIINLQCRSCHNDGFASGGVNLQDYEDVKNSVLNGTLLKSIKHEAGASPMPQGAPKLDECDIVAFEKWAGAGAPNN